MGLGCFWLEFCVSWDSEQMCHLSSELCQHFVAVHQSAPVPRLRALPTRQQSRGEARCVNRYINAHSEEINKHVGCCEIQFAGDCRERPT